MCGEAARFGLLSLMCAPTMTREACAPAVCNDLTPNIFCVITAIFKQHMQGFPMHGVKGVFL